jgi:hypothetical protein
MRAEARSGEDTVRQATATRGESNALSASGDADAADPGLAHETADSLASLWDGADLGTAAPEDRGIAFLAFRVGQMLASAPSDVDDLRAAAMSLLERLPFELAPARFDMERAKVRDSLPDAVVEAWRFYDECVADPGWGEVLVWDAVVGSRFEDVYILHAPTDGEDGYLEVYTAEGEPLASGMTEAGRLSEWDERFGDVRYIAGELTNPG